MKSTDLKLEEAFNKCIQKGNLSASTNPKVISKADYIIVDINLDVDISQERGSIDFNGFSNAIKTIGNYIKKDALVIIETTVPPGTTDKIVYPILKKACMKGLIKMLHHYLHIHMKEMPGPNYFDSITNFWRVFAGYNKESSENAVFFSTL